MKHLQILSATALTAVLLPVLAGSAEAALIKLIDPLNDSQSVVGTLPGTYNATPTPVVSPLLGNVTRDMMLNIATNTTNNNATVNIPRGVGDPGITFSTGDGVNALTMINYTGFSDVDFTMGGADRITLEIIFSDFGGNLTLNVDGTDIDLTYPPLVTPGSPVPIDVFFSDFPAVDFTDVDSLKLTIDPPVAGDVSIRLFGTQGPMNGGGTTPEPGTVFGLLAIGALGVKSAFKKKQG